MKFSTLNTVLQSASELDEDGAPLPKRLPITMRPWEWLERPSSAVTLKQARRDAIARNNKIIQLVQHSSTARGPRPLVGFPLMNRNTCSTAATRRKKEKH